jgi:hypothetical protein
MIPRELLAHPRKDFDFTSLVFLSSLKPGYVRPILDPILRVRGFD